MQLKKKLMYSGIIATVTLITSILIPIIPCKIAPGIPKSIYKWTLCSLNTNNINVFGSIKKYFGYTTSLTEAHILTVLLTFVVVMVLLHFTTKKKIRIKRR